MLYYADLHLHSKYSRAVSQNMNLEGMTEGSKRKGTNLLGTGDFTHPQWFNELGRKLVPANEYEHNGLYKLRGVKDSCLFMLTVEISTIYSQGTGWNGVKKVHHVIHIPTFEEAVQLNDVYSKLGNLSADGRPTFGNLSPSHFAELTFETSKNAVIVPAHCWTPHFSIFGSMSGFNSLEEGYEDQAKKIFAIETGLSSTPAMNWRISKLDRVTCMSSSDAHSPHPWRLGRECNCFDFTEKEISFENLFKAVKEKDEKHFLYTVEVDPSYGKYHFDGHRNCSFSCSPEESKKLKNICPVCKRRLTIGVLNRVEELADRPEGYVPEKRIPFKSLLPLHELISAVMGVQLSSKKVMEESDKLINAFGNELNVLLNVNLKEIEEKTNESIAQAVQLNREGKIKVTPGYDGEYGIPLIGKQKNKQKRIESKREAKRGQKTLEEY